MRGIPLIQKLKNLLKVKEYSVKESYSEGGFDIQVKEDEDAEQLISLREHAQTPLIEVTKHEDVIKHVIYDSLRGVKTEIDIPISVYRKVMKHPKQSL